MSYYYRSQDTVTDIHLNRVDRCDDVAFPEVKEVVRPRNGRHDVVELVYKGLKQQRMVGTPVENTQKNVRGHEMGHGTSPLILSKSYAYVPRCQRTTENRPPEAPRGQSSGGRYLAHRRIQFHFIPDEGFALRVDEAHDTSLSLCGLYEVSDADFRMDVSKTLAHGLAGTVLLPHGEDELIAVAIVLPRGKHQSRGRLDFGEVVHAFEHDVLEQCALRDIHPETGFHLLKLLL